MGIADHYTYRVRWSAADQGYVGTVAELASLSWLADTPVTALQGIHDLATRIVSEMPDAGEVPPQAIAERSYSGKFMVRIPAEAHRRLAVEAAEQGVSLNQLALARLVDAASRR